jgi:hypothetical protein
MVMATTMAMVIAMIIQNRKKGMIIQSRKKRRTLFFLPAPSLSK